MTRIGQRLSPQTYGFAYSPFVGEAGGWVRSNDEHQFDVIVWRATNPRDVRERWAWAIVWQRDGETMTSGYACTRDDAIHAAQPEAEKQAARLSISKARLRASCSQAS